jgi:hypothetical protein
LKDGRKSKKRTDPFLPFASKLKVSFSQLSALLLHLLLASCVSSKFYWIILEIQEILRVKQHNLQELPGGA